MQTFDSQTGLNESIYFDYVPVPSYAGHYNQDPFRVVITSQTTNPHVVTLKSKYSKSYDTQNDASKWSFLRPEAKFFDLSGNQIESIITNDTPIYVSSDGSYNSVSGTFIGVSGYADFYFVDDIYNYDLAFNDERYTTIAALLQTSGIAYFDDTQAFHILNTNYVNSLAVAYQPHIFRYRDPDYIKISENGIRDFINPRWVPANQHVVFTLDWDSDTNKSLNLYPVKPNSNFNKSFPSNTNTNTIEITAKTNKIKTYFPFNKDLEISYKDSDSYLKPGYLKTLFNVGTGASNVRLSAISTFGSPDVKGLFYTPRMWLSNPNAGLMSIAEYNFPLNYNLDEKSLLKAYIHNFEVPIVNPQNFRNINGDNQDPFSTSGYHDITSIAVLSTHEAFAVDAELNTLYKFSSKGEILSAIDLVEIAKTNLNIQTPDQVSPTSIVVDGEQNLWITLYDNRYVLNLDSNGNYMYALDLISSIPYSPVPGINTNWFKDNQPYPDLGYNQGFVEPTFVDVDSKNYLWVTYSNYASGYLLKFDKNNNVYATISYPVCSCPQDLIVDNKDNVWVALSNNIYNSIGSIEKRDTNGNLLSSFGSIMGVNELALDVYQNLWFTYSYCSVGVIDNITGEIITFNDVADPSIAPSDLTIPSKNTDETALEGIACDLKGYVYVVNSIENRIYVFNAKTKKYIDKFYINPQGFTFWNPYELGPTIIEYNVFNKSLKAHGDWMGTKWINKYNKLQNYTITVSGISDNLEFVNIPSTKLRENHSFLATTYYQYIDTNFIQQIMVTPEQSTEPINFYWNLDVFKVNENFDLAGQLKSYALMPTLYNSQYLFDKFLPSIYGFYPFNHNDLGIFSYEKISNFISNRKDIDTCELDALYDIVEMTDNNTEDYLLAYPEETKRLINLFSVNASRLFGSNAKNLNNFMEPDSEGNYNKGKLLYDSSKIYAGDPVILKSKSLNSYELIQTGNIPDINSDKVTNSLNNFIQVISGLPLPVENINHSINNFIDTIQNYANAPKTTPNGVVKNQTYYQAASAIAAFKPQLQQQIVEYAKYYYPDVLNNNSLSAKCFRDTGYIVDAIVADLINNANHRCVEVGDMYFKGSILGKPKDDGSSVPTLPKDEVVATISAINQLKTFISPLIANHNRLNEIFDRIDDITYPLQNSGSLKSYIPSGSPTQDAINAASLFEKYKNEIQEDVSVYVQAKGYLTDPILISKCKRDSGLIIDAIINDLLTGVTARSIEYALAYWDGSTSRLPEDKIENQIINTQDTFVYINSKLRYLAELNGYGSVTDSLLQSINRINNIIRDKNQSDVLPTLPGGVINDDSYSQTSNILISNKQLLQSKVVQYVHKYYPDALGSNSLLASKCYRDVGYIVDALAADIKNNANHRSVEVGNMYFKGTLADDLNVGSTTIPTLPEDQVIPTINCINVIKSYITGQDIPQYPIPFTTTGILSSSTLGAARKTDVVELVDAVLYPLINNGEKVEYKPAGKPTEIDIQAAQVILQNKNYIQNTISDYVKSKGFITQIRDKDVVATYEQKCYRDIGYMVDAIVNDLSTGVYSKSVEYALSYWNGSTSRLPKAYIPYHILYMVYTLKEIQKLLLTFSIKSKIIPQTTPNGKVEDDSYQEASDAILKNKEKLQKQIIDYSNYFYPYALSAEGLSAKCYRDVGYIVDAIAADIANNANHRSIDVSDIYFKGPVLLRESNPDSNIPTLPQDQITATISAISAIGAYITGNDIPKYPSTLSQFTSSGILSSIKLSQRSNDVINRINDILYTLQNNGDRLPYNPPGNPNSKDIELANIFIENKTMIQELVSRYVKGKRYITDSVYDLTLVEVYEQKCYRDIGLMIDAIVNDLTTGVVSKSIQYALAYWDGSTARLPQNLISNQQEYTIDTIKHLNELLIKLNPELLTPIIYNKYTVETLAEFIGLYKTTGNWQNYYEFYKYVPTDNNNFYKDNIIDWNNPQTTLSKNISSIFELIGDEQILDTLFSYDLYKGLGIV